MPEAPVPLQLVIRTPHEIVLDERLRAARVPAASGQVGLRPREEPFLLVVEPGLILLRGDEGLRFAATSGGLLDCGRERSVLLTPFAVVGERDTDVLAALDRALATPDSELAARRRLNELEQRIVKEIRYQPPPLRVGERS
jgi:F0F1-type ATP synthase epsilon subunit